MNRTWKVVGINFDHMHMGDLLREVHEHPHAEIVGVCDEQPERMVAAVDALGIPAERQYTDYRRCLEETRPDLALLCPATAEHGLWTKRVAEFNVHILVEKPFAASLKEADEMIAAQEATGKLLAINWPLRWYPCYITAKRIIDEGQIGEVLNVHHYGGNRGPLFHAADKLELTPTAEDKAKSWFYNKALGGGSLLDYAGYGATLGTWFQSGRKPLDVTCVSHSSPGIEVDEHSIIIARYAHGLSKFETRWGTFTDPWTHQPQPKCGFVICGTKGTISAYDYENTVRLQTLQDLPGSIIPADIVSPPYQNPIQYLLHCIETGEPLTGPLSPHIARIGQHIVDTALMSSREARRNNFAD